jgi:hypothetical protein
MIRASTRKAETTTDATYRTIVSNITAILWIAALYALAGRYRQVNPSATVSPKRTLEHFSALRMGTDLDLNSLCFRCLVRVAKASPLCSVCAFIVIDIC